MKRITYKIRTILGIDVWEHRTRTLESKVVKLEKEVEFLNSLVKIGVDIHFRSDSWAVVCINGKAEYVNFFVLKDMDAREIKSFLRKFDNRNITLDLPRGYTRELFMRG